MVGPPTLDNPDALPEHLREYALDDLQNQLCGLHPEHCIAIGAAIAASGVWSVLPEYTAAGHKSANIVREATRTVMNTYTNEQMLAQLTPDERAHMRSNPWSVRMWYGHAVHRATAEQLEKMYPKRFTYGNRGIDFRDKVTGAKVELTTVGQLNGHLGKWPDTAHVAYRVGVTALGPFGR